ncbi:hypothetical protein EDWATA_02644, partial [Edwardsiella tarda ATCC 23685]
HDSSLSNIDLVLAYNHNMRTNHTYKQIAIHCKSLLTLPFVNVSKFTLCGPEMKFKVNLLDLLK